MKGVLQTRDELLAKGALEPFTSSIPIRSTAYRSITHKLPTPNYHGPVGSSRVIHEEGSLHNHH